MTQIENFTIDTLGVPPVPDIDFLPPPNTPGEFTEILTEVIHKRLMKQMEVEPALTYLISIMSSPIYLD